MTRIYESVAEIEECEGMDYNEMFELGMISFNPDSNLYYVSDARRR